MNTKLQSQIEAAIEKIIERGGESDSPPWDEFIHPSLHEEMARAAASVFDAAMNGQKYYKQQI